MPQARRIKPVKKQEKPKRSFNLRLPWGLLIVVGISAFVVFKLIQGATQDSPDSASLGQGLKAWWEKSQQEAEDEEQAIKSLICLLYTSPSPRDLSTSRMPSSA